MGLGKLKIEGGSNKKHSQVCHWQHTEDIKRITKKKRRIEDKKIKR